MTQQHQDPPAAGSNTRHRSPLIEKTTPSASSVVDKHSEEVDALPDSKRASTKHTGLLVQNHPVPFDPPHTHSASFRHAPSDNLFMNRFGRPVKQAVSKVLPDGAKRPRANVDYSDTRRKRPRKKPYIPTQDGQVSLRQQLERCERKAQREDSAVSRARDRTGGKTDANHSVSNGGGVSFQNRGTHTEGTKAQPARGDKGMATHLETLQECVDMDLDEEDEDEDEQDDDGEEYDDDDKEEDDNEEELSAMDESDGASQLDKKSTDGNDDHCDDNAQATGNSNNGSANTVGTRHKRSAAKSVSHCDNSTDLCLTDDEPSDLSMSTGEEQQDGETCDEHEVSKSAAKRESRSQVGEATGNRLGAGASAADSRSAQDFDAEKEPETPQDAMFGKQADNLLPDACMRRTPPDSTHGDETVPSLGVKLPEGCESGNELDGMRRGSGALDATGWHENRALGVQDTKRDDQREEVLCVSAEHARSVVSVFVHTSIRTCSWIACRLMATWSCVAQAQHTRVDTFLVEQGRSTSRNSDSDRSYQLYVVFALTTTTHCSYCFGRLEQKLEEGTEWSVGQNDQDSTANGEGVESRTKEGMMSFMRRWEAGI